MPREQINAQMPEVEANAIHDFADTLGIGLSWATKRPLGRGLEAVKLDDGRDYLALVAVCKSFAEWSKEGRSRALVPARDERARSVRPRPTGRRQGDVSVSDPQGAV